MTFLTFCLTLGDLSAVALTPPPGSVSFSQLQIPEAESDWANSPECAALGPGANHRSNHLWLGK